MLIAGSDKLNTFCEQTCCFSYCQTNSDTVEISVNYLRFSEHAPVYDSDDVTKLFVEYRFLNLAPEETEAPHALPKPAPDAALNFDFAKSKFLHCAQLYDVSFSCCLSVSHENSPLYSNNYRTCLLQFLEWTRKTSMRDANIWRPCCCLEIHQKAGMTSEGRYDVRR